MGPVFVSWGPFPVPRCLGPKPSSELLMSVCGWDSYWVVALETLSDGLTWEFAQAACEGSPARLLAGSLLLFM